MNSKHMPTPWTISYENSERLTIEDPNGQSIALSNMHRENGDTDEANMLHIVHCVNQHDKLVEALKACENVIGFARLQGKLDDSGLSETNNALLLARACLDDERAAKTP